MSDRYVLARRVHGFAICDEHDQGRVILVPDDEAMGQRIVRLLNEEEHWLGQEPPPEAGWIDSLND